MKTSFLQTGISTAALSLSAVAAFAADGRPNILYIMSDDHSFQTIGVYASVLKDYVKTPNIDRIANEGVKMENCFVTNSISTPSRAAILTGQYSHHNQVYTLADELPAGHPSMAKELQKNGYQTAIVGKWHIGTQPEGKDKVRAKAAPTRRSVDDGKVTDHHALLVTGEKPLFLSKEDNTIYQMIAGRMVEAFSEKCVKDVTTVTAECAGVEFTVKGSVVKQTGWRAVYGEEKEEITIPGWQEGDTLTPKGSSITEGKTKPKPLHTEATLLSAMETAGKEIEDDALRQAMKDCGIGTPATRASIIETLFKRGYMERCKKSLVPTEKGLALNSVVKTMRIADVAMTGEWEKELARIERGELSDDTFRKEIEAYTREITSELISCDKLFGSRDSGCACPKCGTGRMRFYGKVVRCDNTECGLPVFRLKAGRTLSDDEIKDLLTEGHTKLLKGFKSKQGKSFDAVVAFDGEYNTTFVFPEAKKDKKFSGRKK